MAVQEVRGVRHAVEMWPTLLLLAVYAGVYLQFAAQLASFPFDLDQGEGYDAWSAWMINLGQLPYTTNADFPYYSSNYPPLWSYLVSIPMAWLGPGLAAARLVSTISAVAAAGVLGIAAQRLSGRPLAGALAAGFFLASPYVFHTTPLARVNSLALLMAVIGLTLLERPTRRRVLLGSLALVAALFTKPTAVDAVLGWNRNPEAAGRGDDATLLHIAVHAHAYLILGDTEGTCGFGSGDRGAAVGDQVVQQVQRAGRHGTHLHMVTFR